MSNTITMTPVPLPIESTASVPAGFDAQSCRDFWMGRRDALLREIDVIERALGINPRTAELRKWEKGAQR